MFEVAFWILSVLVAILIPVCIDLARQTLKLEDHLHFSNKAHMATIKELSEELTRQKRETELALHSLKATENCWDKTIQEKNLLNVKLEELCKTCKHTCKANEDCLGNDGADYRAAGQEMIFNLQNHIYELEGQGWWSCYYSDHGLGNCGRGDTEGPCKTCKQFLLAEGNKRILKG